VNGRRPVRVGVIGNAGLDGSGQLRDAARLAALIQTAGAQTTLAGLIESGPVGESIKAQLVAAGVDISNLAISDKTAIALGDQIDVAGLFAMDAVLIGVSDFKLHRFLVDLPVHTAPNARLIGLLSHLAASPCAGALEIALLHDLVIATVAEIQVLVGTGDASAAIDEFQRRMPGSNLRTAAIFAADGQSSILTKNDRFVGNATEFENFAADVSVAFAARAPWAEVFNRDRFA